MRVHTCAYVCELFNRLFTPDTCHCNSGKFHPISGIQLFHFPFFRLLKSFCSSHNQQHTFSQHLFEKWNLVNLTHNWSSLCCNLVPTMSDVEETKTTIQVVK